MATSKLQKAITEIKRPFMAFASSFGKITETRAELAPKFMRTFGLYQADETNEEAKSFVGFVRLIDPSVPTDRDAYRVHATYMAADYLRRLRRTDKGEKRAKPVRSNLAGLGRLLATVQAITSEPEKLWKGVQAELNLTARQVTKLRQVTAASQPLIKIPNIKPLRVQIIHVDQAAAQAAVSASRSAARAAA